MAIGQFFFGFLSLLAWALSLILAQAHATVLDNSAARCNALRTADFSRIPDALTQVTDAKVMPSTEGAIGHCEVRGYVAPRVGFLLRLPTDNWNGRFLELGCGASCGTADDHSFVHPFKCDDPLRRGYACIVSDGGNRSSGLDMKWAYNDPQAVIEYLFRASHVTALAGRAIAEHYYGRDSSRSYFMGCSAGGVQGMLEAQRFPWDFDGIVVGAPCVNITGILMSFLWNSRALTGKNGEPLLGLAELKLLHQAVVEKCDMNDGVKDGLIGDPRKCHFNASELRCTTSKNSRCLTAQQIDAAEKIYEGPHTSKGEQIAMPTAQRGSEMTWLGLLEGSVASPNLLSNYFQDWFRYYLFQPNPGPTWEPSAFDFDRDYRRLGMGEVPAPANSPDLRRFKASGGKLLVFTGWNDWLEGVLGTVDYYEAAERIIGERVATQDFFRLFVVPGMGHCGGGDGAYAVDYLSYLEAWVERGSAPEKLIGSHLKLDQIEIWGRGFPPDPLIVAFSRPVYPYPIGMKYLGHGDPNDAASFGPEMP